MIQRVWETVKQYLGSDSENHATVDACIECGEPSFPGAGRCVECLDN
ncbi:hypothetical protein SAMN05443574_1415 [Haloarcula vallismortis]|uniref:Uncharacterized protein n=1 Tax=Haloarcula vallismortis TaxID=28442 RepID=A0A1H3BAZ4_HALVA|nr:hypothetical protein SAMN05443574_1415 [Haloarcula vallismortis]